MKNPYKTVKITSVFFVGLLMLIPFFINAQTLAKVENKETILEGMAEIKIETVEDRKNALLTIIDLTLLEIQDLEKQLNALKDLEMRFADMRNDFLIQLDNHTKYLESVEKILNTEGFTMDSIKKLAQELKDWRENEYAQTVKNIIDFLLTFHNQAVLKIADNRFYKITVDLKRFKAAKLIETGTLEPLLAKAGENLREARALNNEALSLLATSTTPIIVSGTIQELVQQSLNEIKSAYKLFFQMSALVRKMLKL